MADTINVYESKELVSKKTLKEVVKELVGDEALPLVEYLKGKNHISEFILAEELDIEIHDTRRLLYKLLENNIVSFKRKKDKTKGWYICYWNLNEKAVPFLETKIKKEKLNKLKDRLENEEGSSFYMCGHACVRMSFEEAMEFDFKCPECGELMKEQDNARTIDFLKEKISNLENEVEA